ncbi:hypothetical protein IWQ62_001454 [Dispira parvispora]|uniref:Uncharacterized protein n=1 Tax=Dispira parvispora TaxID=1520584 RepID=A0A9W8AXX9_9FUNG|nr:hypothetical protein IWQ62_001454 [Dispira parvispora]
MGRFGRDHGYIRIEHSTPTMSRETSRHCSDPELDALLQETYQSLQEPDALNSRGLFQRKQTQPECKPVDKTPHVKSIKPIKQSSGPDTKALLGGKPGQQKKQTLQQFLANDGHYSSPHLFEERISTPRYGTRSLVNDDDAESDDDEFENEATGLLNHSVQPTPGSRAPAFNRTPSSFFSRSVARNGTSDELTASPDYNQVFSTCPQAQSVAQQAFQRALKHTGDYSAATKAAAAAATAVVLTQPQPRLI